MNQSPARRGGGLDEAASEASPSAGGASILLIDDDHGMLSALREELEGFGHSVEAVSDGASAILRLKWMVFDVVVTDVRMPGVTGLEVLSAAKDHDPDSEVIVITAHVDIGTALSCLRGGASDLLRKPFDGFVLELSVARALERRRRRHSAILHGAGHAILAGSAREGQPPLVAELAPDSSLRRVLVVEDNPGDAELVRMALAEDSARFVVHHVERLSDALACPCGDVDAVLLAADPVEISLSVEGWRDGAFAADGAGDDR